MIESNKLTANEEKENKINFLINAKGMPCSKSRGPKGNIEMLKLTDTYKPRAYPKRLKTDNDRFIYLKDLLGKNEVNKEIFIELASVLAIKKEKMYDVLREKEVSILDLFGGLNNGNKKE